MIRKLTAAAIGAASALIASSAFAQTTAAPAPATATSSSSADNLMPTSGGSLAVLLGLGTDHQNFGLGVRGGYTLPMDTGPGHIYLGGQLQYFFGTSSSVDGFSSSVHFLHFGVEGGYELPAGPVTVRPYVGLGLVDAIASTSGNVEGFSASGSNSSTDFAFTLGCTGLYAITPNWGVGADARFVIVNDYNSFIFAITGQYHF